MKADNSKGRNLGPHQDVMIWGHLLNAPSEWIPHPEQTQVLSSTCSFLVGTYSPIE
jgi:hypothetical protein